VGRDCTSYFSVTNLCPVCLHDTKRSIFYPYGLITGEALVGILMAIPIVISEKADALAIVSNPVGAWPVIILLLPVVLWLGRVATPGKDINKS
jgi:hypothetical protein